MGYGNGYGQSLGNRSRGGRNRAYGQSLGNRRRRLGLTPGDIFAIERVIDRAWNIFIGNSNQVSMKKAKEVLRNNMQIFLMMGMFPHGFTEHEFYDYWRQIVGNKAQSATKRQVKSFIVSYTERNFV